MELRKKSGNLAFLSGKQSYLTPSAKSDMLSDVSDITKAPEMLGGRVKTLHPAVHGGLLFSHMYDLLY